MGEITNKVKKFLFEPKSLGTRTLAKSQAAIARLPSGKTPFLTNQDKIGLSHASLENTMLANRQKQKENQSTDSNQ